MRQKWIDNAKGIAILLVMLGHLSGIWNLDFVNGFHLVTFFLLSGFTVKKTVFDAAYANKKFTRLMKPYFLTCTAIMAADLLNSRIFLKDSSIITATGIIFRDLLRSFYASGSYTAAGSAEMGVRIGAIWFFPAMFFALMVFQGLLQITEDERKLGVYSLIIAAAGHLSARFVWLPFSIQSGMMASFFLYIGYMIRRKGILDRIRPADYVIALIVLIAVIRTGYSAVFFVTANIRDYIFTMAGGLSGFLLIYLISLKLQKAAVLPKIGQYSSTVLCMHLFSLECMPRVFSLLLDDLLGLNGWGREIPKIILYIVFAVLAAFAAEYVKARYAGRKKTEKKESGRDKTADIAKGIFITAMLAGHFDMDPGLRAVIYSCHMAGFVFYSGYFYRRGKSVRQTFLRMCRTFLVPYAAAAALTLLMNHESWSAEYFAGWAKKYLLGMSFSKNLFGGASSVGPVYFILLLFAARILYTVIDHAVPERRYKYAAIIAVSAAGYYLGKAGWWLPWSFDIGCYCVLFYWFGALAGEHHILQSVRGHHSLYFFLSSVCAYMIYKGSMEIAVRNYGNFGLTAAGALCGILLVHMLSSFLEKNAGRIGKFLALAGSSTIYILIIHTVFRKQIYTAAGMLFHEGYFGFFLCAILLQLIGGILVSLLLGRLKKPA